MSDVVEILSTQELNEAEQAFDELAHHMLTRFNRMGCAAKKRTLEKLKAFNETLTEQNEESILSAEEFGLECEGVV